MADKKKWREMTRQEKWCADNPVDAAAEIQRLKELVKRWKTKARQFEEQRTHYMREAGLLK